MPFCPKCYTEYPPEVSACPECQLKLIKSLPPDPNQGVLFEIVELCKISDEITAMALRSFLADGGIDATVQEMQASFYGSVLNPGNEGYWGKLLVDRHQEAKARRLLDAFQREFQTR